MAVISMKHFLEAGVHFGHQTKRWNPKMAPYIYGVKSGIHIIDLRQTLRKLQEAYQYVKQASSEGKSMLFVGTKQNRKDWLRWIMNVSACLGNSIHISNFPRKKYFKHGNLLIQKKVLVDSWAFISSLLKSRFCGWEFFLKIAVKDWL